MTLVLDLLCLYAQIPRVKPVTYVGYTNNLKKESFFTIQVKGLNLLEEEMGVNLQRNLNQKEAIQRILYKDNRNNKIKKKISILLPYKENFSPEYPGAVSLFVYGPSKLVNSKNITVLIQI